MQMSFAALSRVICAKVFRKQEHQSRRMLVNVEPRDVWAWVEPEYFSARIVPKIPSVSINLNPFWNTVAYHLGH